MPIPHNYYCSLALYFVPYDICVMIILSLHILSKIGPCFRLYYSNNEKWNYLDSIHIFIKLNENQSNWEWTWRQRSIVVRILLYVSTSFSDHGPSGDGHPLHRVPWSAVINSIYITSTCRFCLYFFFCKDFVVPLSHPLFLFLQRFLFFILFLFCFLPFFFFFSLYK